MNKYLRWHNLPLERINNIKAGRAAAKARREAAGISDSRLGSKLTLEHRANIKAGMIAYAARRMQRETDNAHAKPI